MAMNGAIHCRHDYRRRSHRRLSGTQFLRFERRGPLAYVTVDRPEARNALTSAMYFGHSARGRPRERGTRISTGSVITGTGDVFIPGGEMSGRHDDGDHRRHRAYLGHRHAPLPDAPPEPEARDRERQRAVSGRRAHHRDVRPTSRVASERAVFRAPETLRGVVDVNLATLLPAHVGVALRSGPADDRAAGPGGRSGAMGLIARMCAHDDLEPPRPNEPRVTCWRPRPRRGRR